VAHNPDVKVTVYFEGEYLKNSVSQGQRFYRTLICSLCRNQMQQQTGYPNQAIEWYHFQRPSMTFDPNFKIPTLFEVEYLKKGRVLLTKLL